MSDTARLALPLLESGQAQKELTHNEALALIDLGMHAEVEAVGVDLPPGAPAIGECWVVGTAPVGAWTGQAGAIAGWTAGGWRFLRPREGMRAWNRAAGREATRADGAWEDGVVRASRVIVDGTQVVGARRPAVALPTGGTVIDTEARAAMAQLLAALTAHGLLAA